MKIYRFIGEPDYDESRETQLDLAMIDGVRIVLFQANGEVLHRDENVLNAWRDYIPSDPTEWKLIFDGSC